MRVTIQPAYPSVRPIRSGFFLLAVGCLWLGGAVAPGQERPEKEEEKSKPLKKVVVEDDAPPPKAATPAPATPKAGPDENPPPQTPGTPAPAQIDPNTTTPPPDAPPPVAVDRSTELTRAATTARSPALRQFLTEFVVAFDRITEAPNKVTKIAPVPLLWGKDKFPPGFGVSELDSSGNAAEGRETVAGKVRRIEPFERVAIAAVDELLKPTPGPAPPTAASPGDTLAAAEMVLSRVLFFHDSAREQNKRRGKNWDAVKTEVYDKLTEVRIARVKQVAVEKDWVKLKELSTRMTQLYKGNTKVLEPVYAARLAEAEPLVLSARVNDLERGREILNDYEARFPNSGNETARKVRQALANQAKKFMTDAERIFGQGNQTEARNLLKTVEALNPDDPNLRQLQQQLKTGYPVLVVGTLRPPERMSPPTARLDSEKQAAELMFEGLYDAIPDDQLGVRFVPALAAERPGIGAGVRDVQLVRAAEWTGNGVFDATDVAGTLRLARQGAGTWAADPVGWLDEPSYDPSDAGRIRLKFRLGHPDPRGLLTWKLLPASWLLQKNKKADDAEFARMPFGTGPFKLAPNFQPAKPGDPPRDVVFVSNPAYGRRPGKIGQPFIKEVRFVDVSGVTDVVNEFRAERLHVLADVPTPDLPKFEANNGLNGRVRVVTAKDDRRVHILAVNHRRPHLQVPDLRRGLSQAIDREKILNDVYRGAKLDTHRALTGPFPPNSWATPKTLGGSSVALFNRDTAQAKLKSYLADPRATPTLTLVYAADDPQARGACERIKFMVEAATTGEERKITIGLEPLPFRELIRRVEDEHRYDLAYLPFDYPDDWYPQTLGSFLDPEATAAGGRNLGGYRAKGTTPAAEDDRFIRRLEEVRLHRDPVKLEQLSHDLHRAFNEAVPFVPLWQLDRHTILATTVKIYFDGQVDAADPRLLNPTTLFTSIGRWRIE